MRDYSKVSPKFWIGDTGKKIKKGGPEAVIVAMYLMTSPHANMLGLYYQPEVFIAHETGLGFEGASKGLQRCIEAGFCRYDSSTEIVWVIEMATYQIAESLSASDNQCKGIQREYSALPENPYLAPFFEKYAVAFNMTKKRDFEVKTDTPLEAPSNPLRSQEQEQEQEQEKEQEQTSLSPSAPPAPNTDVDPVVEIFAYWQKTMHSPRSKLDDKRRKAIKNALKLDYSPRDICRAIRGCSLTPHNMGKNDQGQKYNDIGLILRDAAHIDRFIANDIVPPRPNGTNLTSQDRIQQQNAETMRAFLGEQTAPSDHMTIDMEN